MEGFDGRERGGARANRGACKEQSGGGGDSWIGRGADKCTSSQRERARVFAPPFVAFVARDAQPERPGHRNGKGFRYRCGLNVRPLRRPPLAGELLAARNDARETTNRRCGTIR